MFDNIGGKIKGLAKTVFVISVILFVIAGFALGLMFTLNENPLIGFISLFGIGGIGFLISWIGSFFMYGYGQLISDMHDVKNEMEETRSELAQLHEDVNNLAFDFSIEEQSETEPDEKENDTLPCIFENAAKYTADDDMLAYLDRAKNRLPEEDREVIEELLKWPAGTIRSKIKQLRGE